MSFVKKTFQLFGVNVFLGVNSKRNSTGTTGLPVNGVFAHEITFLRFDANLCMIHIKPHSALNNSFHLK